MTAPKMSRKVKILSVVGARPNFMKVAPLHRAFDRSGKIDSKLVHTGQHYDEKMSDVFFNQLELPVPDYYLKVGSGSHAETTARVMIEFEKVVLKESPDLVLVVGDVNSTVACALVASKLHIPVAHVEAGLRSGDRKMPEEINRIITDAISDFLFVSEQSGVYNLRKEGVEEAKVFFVGNVMIDSVVHYMPKLLGDDYLGSIGVEEKDFLLVTLHRPDNVDFKEQLSRLIEILKSASDRWNIVFPMHPRTRSNLVKYGLYSDIEDLPKVQILEPLGYIEFMSLMKSASAIVTDSGGIQEEATYLKVPCITLRTTTERPSTIEQGSNVLIAELDPEIVLKAIDERTNRAWDSSIPNLWDGQASERISKILLSEFQND